MLKERWQILRGTYLPYPKRPWNLSLDIKVFHLKIFQSGVLTMTYIFHIHIFQPVYKNIYIYHYPLIYLHLIDVSCKFGWSHHLFGMNILWVTQQLFAVNPSKKQDPFRALKTWICFYKVIFFVKKRIRKKKHGDSSSPPYFQITTMKNQEMDDFLLSSDSVPSGGAAPFRFTRIGVKSQRFKRTKASVCASNPVARASKISWSAKWAIASVSKMNFKQCSCWREVRKRMMCYIYLTICLWKFSMLGNGVRLLKSWVKMMRKRMRIHKSKLHGLVLIV